MFKVLLNWLLPSKLAYILNEIKCYYSEQGWKMKLDRFKTLSSLVLSFIIKWVKFIL